MNKYYEALDYLRMLEGREMLFFSNRVEPQVNCDVLQELVDLSTPKKLINKKNIYDDCKYLYTTCACPNCKGRIASNKESMYLYSFCPHCGQKLDWSNEDEE